MCLNDLACYMRGELVRCRLVADGGYRLKDVGVSVRGR